MACPDIGRGTPFLSGVLAHVDCQAQTLGTTGYAVLSSPGSSVALMLAGVLTIFVALYGYRLLVGHAPDTRELVVAAVKVGVVLMLATSWPAFRTLAYDVAMHGPADLVAEIAGPSGLPGAGGNLLDHLQFIDDALIELNAYGAGDPSELVNQTPAPQPSATPQAGTQAQAQATPPVLGRIDTVEDNRLLRQARMLYLASTIAAFASVRLVAGLLLALGPLVALLLLFDVTRGMFEGWVRALGGAALGAVSTMIVLGVQMAVTEPWLAAIVADRRSRIPRLEVPVELLALNLVFGLSLLAAMIMVAKVAYGFRLPDSWRGLAPGLSTTLRGERITAQLPAHAPTHVPAEERSRAVAVADAVLLTQRREQAGVGSGSLGSGEDARRAAPVGAAIAQARIVSGPVPLGQTNRRSRPRASARATARDRTP